MDQQTIGYIFVLTQAIAAIALIALAIIAMAFLFRTRRRD